MSDANQTAISYARENAFATPYPALSAVGVAGTNIVQALRFTKDGLLNEKETITSEEIRSDRMVQELIRVGLKNSGTIEAELSFENYDDFMEAAFQSEYGTTINVTATFNHTTGTITASTGSPFKAIKNAKHVKVSNAATAANNGVKPVVAMTDTVITCGAGQFTVSDAGDAITIQVTFIAEYFEAASGACDVTSTNTITLTSGTFSAVIQAARYVYITVENSPNGIYKVVSCSATVLVLDTTALGNSTGNDGTFGVCYFRTGKNYMTYLIQKEFTDIAAYIAFTGMGIDTYDFAMEAKNKVMQTFGFLGCQGQSRTAKVNTVSAVAAATTGIINTSSMIGSLRKDGAAFGNPVQAASFQVKNNLREKPNIGSLVSQQHGSGFSEITGELRVYFTSTEMFTAFLNHTAFSVEFPITDVAGNVMNIYLPSVQTATGSPENSGVNTDVMQTVQFRALPSAALGYQIQVDRLEAAGM